jgi:hypothetical protein
MVLAAIGAVQPALTCALFMHALFASWPIPLLDGCS